MTSRILLLTCAAFVIAANIPSPTRAQNLGQILQGLSGNHGNSGWGGNSNGGAWGRNQQAGNWFNTSPRFRTEQRTDRVWVPGQRGSSTGGNTELGWATKGHWENNTRTVRVPDGYNVTPDIGRIVVDGVRALGSLDRGGNGSNNSYQDSNREPTYQTPVRPAAPVLTNRPPAQVEKARDVLPNVQPYDGSLNLADEERQELVESEQRDIERTRPELYESLGVKPGDDPAVDAAVDEFLDKGKNGTLTEDDKAGFAQTMKDLGVTATDAGALDTTLGDVLDKSTAVASLNAEGDGEPGLLETIFSFPELPEGDTVVLGDGSIGVGTGGEGELAVIQGDPSDILGMEIGVGEPVSDFDGDVAKRVKDGTLLMNPVKNGVEVQYVLANTNYTMQPGHSQPLPAGRTWVIKFDRGEGRGQAEYTLTDGTYFFGASDHGWELFKQEFKVTIRNEGNESAFHYNIDNTQCQVDAGSSRSHTSTYPILVRFDRGNGEEAQKKVLEQAATFQLAVDRRDGLWDLYPAEQGTQADESNRVGTNGDTASKTGKAAKARSARLRSIMLHAAKK